MALNFRSAQRRTFWLAIIFSLLIEYAVIATVMILLGVKRPEVFWQAVFLLIGVQIFLGAYGLLSFGRRAIFYYMFERDDRADTLAGEFNRLGFPRPDGFYNDADQYLEQVALNPATPPEGALFAGVLLGMLNGHRANGPRSEAFFLAMSIERAMRRMLPWEARRLD